MPSQRGSRRRSFGLEAQAGHLVRFLATGGGSPTVRGELRALEAGLHGLSAELADLDRTAAVVAPRVHRTWVLAQLEHFEDLLATDRGRAKIEIMKHLDGELTIFPQPSLAGERCAEVRGRAKANGLLPEQEAVPLELVAGGRFGSTADSFGLEFRVSIAYPISR